MKSNFLDLPTDCPQRERAGWTGDAQIFTPSASFLMDTRAFFRKWLKELSLEQFPSGMVGNFVPNPYRLIKGGMANLLKRLDGSAGWGDVATIMPWALYWAYGDTQMLERQYESMKAWVDYVQKQAKRVNWVKEAQPCLLVQPLLPRHPPFDLGYRLSLGRMARARWRQHDSYGIRYAETPGLWQPGGGYGLLRQLGAHPG